jgi:hypothetical protein
MTSQIGQSERLWIGDQLPEDSVTLGQRTDGGALGFAESVRDELAELLIAADHSERAIASVHDSTRSFHDLLQHDRQAQVAADHQHGVEQSLHPIDGLEHFAGSAVKLP